MLIIALPFCCLLQAFTKHVFGGKSPKNAFLTCNNAQKMGICYGRSYYLPQAMPNCVAAIIARLGAVVKYFKQRLLGLKQ